MSATTSADDKFAFLFQTSDSTEDLSQVRSTLKDYYGYKDSNIINSKGCNNFIADFQSLPAALQSATPQGTVPAGETKRHTLVVFICGSAGDGGLKDSTITTDPVILSWDDIQTIASGDLPGAPPTDFFDELNVEVNFVVITPWVNGLMGGWKNNLSIKYGTLLIPVTVSDNIDHAARQAFIDNVVGLLRLSAGSVIDPVTGMQSFNDIAKTIHGTQPIFYWISGGEIYYPGRPEFRINDGTNWTDSPEIKIVNTVNTAGGNAYLMDITGNPLKNKVKINVLHSGTHPVKSYKANAGIYRAGQPAPDATREIPGLGQILPGNNQGLSIDDFSFNYNDYNKIVASVTVQGGVNLINADPDNKFCDAIRVITWYEEALSGYVESKGPASAPGVSDGRVVVKGTGGTFSYQYKLDTGTYLNSGSFSGLSVGPHRVTVMDTNNCTFDVNFSIVLADQDVVRLDNSYISIVHTSRNELRITFKNYPFVPSGFTGYRYYKIRWKGQLPHPHVPFYPPTEVTMSHISVSGTGEETVSGTNLVYAVLKVPSTTTGVMLIKHPLKPWPYGNYGISVPVEIFYIKYRKLLPPLYILIAKFQLNIRRTFVDATIIP